jgi:2-hydroxychromene-2-carboxylate isomerase
MKPILDFFLFYGSIYTYLTVMRIEKLASSNNVEVRWRPFNLREILIEQNNTSFAKNKAKVEYSWRDIERRAARHGIEFVSRPPYPVDPELLALRIGTIAATEGWCAEYTKATFRAWFVERQTVGSPRVAENILVDLDRPAKEILLQASSLKTITRLSEETDTARKLGVFGSPSFVIGSEIFWGDDRLEEAIEFATRQ